MAAASAAGGPAGVVDVAGHLRCSGYAPLRAVLPVLAPGAALSGLLDQLGAELATLDEHDLVDVIAAAERVKVGAEAAQLRAMAELAGRAMFAGCAGHGHGDPAHGIRGAASVVSAELRLSPSVAVGRVTLACELVESLPATLTALAAGGSTGTGPGRSPNRPDRLPPHRSCAGPWRRGCWPRLPGRPRHSCGPRRSRPWRPRTRPAPQSGIGGPGPADTCPRPARNRT
ncbi:MAG TPA: hypothetical protein VFG96_07810, partial [Jiangellaceae bacterium]|nr:hypothetical protein [Jiangellaceae bacterium]